MAVLDPLEQTQENLHPVIVAHRARDPGRQERRSALRNVTVMLLLIAAAVCAWALWDMHR